MHVIKKLLSSKKAKLPFIVLSCFATACGSNNSGNNSSTTSQSTPSLQVIAPKIIYSKAGESAIGYVVINNPTNKTISDLSYSLNNQIGSGNKVSIDPISMANCIMVPANSQCNVKVFVPAGAIAGSFGFNVNDNSLLNQLDKSAKFPASTTQTIGVEQSAYNSLSGADGITLNYYHTVINGVSYVIVNGLVASSNAGIFNSIELVDGAGNSLPNQTLISGAISNARGSTFSILLPVPLGNNLSLTIKAQTRQNGQVVSTSTMASTLSTAEDIGIVNSLPSAVYLTESNPEQIVTFSNTGDVAVQLQELISSNSNMEVVFSPTTLASGETTTATLKLKNPSVPATSGSISLTYYDGHNQITITKTVEDGAPPPTPAPGPSPTPTPGPSPTPAPGPSPTPTPGPSPTPAPGPSPTPAPGPSPTPAPGPSPTPAPGPSPTPAPGPSPTPAPGPSPTPAPGPSPTPAPGPTPTPAPGPSPTPTPGPSPTPAPGPSPTPTPEPSPTPTPGPSPTPTPAEPGLMAIMTPNNDFFTTTTTGKESRQLKIINTGNTIENKIVLTLPAHFTISAGASNSCSVTSGTGSATIVDSLAAGSGSCDVTVTYNNTATTGLNSAKIVLNYDYNNGVSAPTPVEVGVNYKVDQATAVLSLSTASTEFANIINNLVDYSQQTYTLTNSGNNATTLNDINISYTTVVPLFEVNGGSCVTGMTLGAAGSGNNSCTIIVKFGPTGTPPGNKDATLNAVYAPYSGAALATTTAALSGVVNTAQTAVITHGPGVPTGFAGGVGLDDGPYQIEEGSRTLPYLSYTYTNTSKVEPATDFYIDGSLSGWVMGGNCGTAENKITLAPGASCKVVFTMSAASVTSVGANNLTLEWYTLHWVDQGDPTGHLKTMSGIEYVNVYAPAQIAITTDLPEDGRVIPGASFKITATLANGYNVPNQVIHAEGSSFTSFSNNDCVISSANSSCDITVNASNDVTIAVEQNVYLSNATGNIAPTPSVVTYSIPIYGKLIFVTRNKYNGDLADAGGSATDVPNGGLDGADSLCNQTDNIPTAGYPKPTLTNPLLYKALINSNARGFQHPDWVLYRDTKYYQYDTNGNLKYVGTTDSSARLPMSMSLGNGKEVWTGSMGGGNTSELFTPGDRYCLGWKNNGAAFYGAYGNDADYNSGEYMFVGDGGSCFTKRYLYCVQQ